MAKQQINHQLALEMTMQDVMGNMEELALDFGFSGSDACFEILAIEPAELTDVAQPSRSTHFRSPYAADIFALSTEKLIRVA